MNSIRTYKSIEEFKNRKTKKEVKVRKSHTEYTEFYRFLVLVERLQRKIRPVDIYYLLAKSGFPHMHALFKTKGMAGAMDWLTETEKQFPTKTYASDDQDNS